jgi:8-oxo-dGTP diphosphatase
MKKCLVFEIAPPDFSATVEAAGCYCQWGDKILLMRRHEQKPQGQTWGVPGGKLEVDETPRLAVIREVQEEAGLDIGEGLVEIGKLYVRLHAVDYIFYLFCKRFESEPHLKLKLDEHDEFKWVTCDEAFHLPLISGGKEALAFYSRHQSAVHKR